MTLAEIVNASRHQLGNFEKPYDWLDDTLVLFATNAINDICRETRMLEDASTGSICNIHTVANVADYALSDYIIYVNSARLLSSELMTLDVAPTPASFAAAATVTGGTSLKTCSVVSCITSTTYSVDHRSGEFTLGEIVSDGTNSGDQGASYPVFTDNSTSGLNLSKARVVEMGSGWRTATATSPTKFLLDYRHGYITFYPTPDAVYTINLSVIRYPLAAFSATVMSSQTPEIPAQYHHALVDGICYQASLKSGEHTYDLKKSNTYLQLFQRSITKMKRDSGMYHANSSTNSPMGGFI